MPDMRFDKKSILPWWGVSIIAVAFIYGGTLHYPLVFDDLINIERNPSITSLFPLWKPFVAPTYTTYGGRPVTNFSFALTYALSGTHPWAHRLWNILLHLMSGLVLMGLVRRVLATGTFGEKLADRALPLAGCTALIWLVHPMNTLPVEFITQRAESQMAFFVLLTFYCSFRSLYAVRRGWWTLAAVVCCLLGAGSKEPTIAAPAVILVFDWLYVSGSPIRALRKSPWLYGGLLLSMVYLVLMALSGRQAATGSLQVHPDALGYAITQTEVITHYLRLVFWPDKLVFNYTWPQARLADVVPQALFIVALLVTVFAGLLRRKGWAFLLFAMFTMLSPSSSVIDIPLRACEYRMYLPMTFLLIMTVAAFFLVADKIRLSVTFTVSCCLIVALVLGVLAWNRNQVFASGLRLWEDTVSKQPHCPTALTWLGNQLIYAQRPAEAIPYLERSLVVKPDDFRTRTNMGLALYLLGKPEKALQYLETALRLNPGYYPARKYSTICLMALKRFDEAAASLALQEKMGVASQDNLLDQLRKDLKTAREAAEKDRQP